MLAYTIGDPSYVYRAYYIHVLSMCSVLLTGGQPKTAHPFLGRQNLECKTFGIAAFVTKFLLLYSQEIKHMNFPAHSTV